MLCQVQSDAVILLSPREPPGNHSHYIHPGNTQDQTYRLATFAKFPFKHGVNMKQLAQNGFLFTGYKDRIKCSSCGQAVENWTLSEVAESIHPEWHHKDCVFVRNLSSKSPQTVGSTKVMDKKISAGDLLMSLHPQKRGTSVMPTSGGLVDTSYQLQTKHETLSKQHEVEEAKIRAEKYPCLDPKNRHMSDEKKRIDTFKRQNWPYHIRATPTDLAKAGFYFIGQHDRVKCWYCGCGLYNWELNDIPWEEHAKQSQRCEFLLRNKGEKFVLHLKCIKSGEGLDVCGPNWPEACQREKARLAAEKVEQEMQNSEAVASVRRLGFDNRTIRKALLRAHETKANVMTTERLMDTCLSLQAETSQTNATASDDSTYNT